MRLFVPRETEERETRVALVPDLVGRLRQSGFEVVVETNAGAQAHFPDTLFIDAGATIATDARAAYAESGAVLKVRAPRERADLGAHEADLLREGAVLIGFLGRPLDADLMARLRARRVSAFAMESVPRITRGQKMDALSSMSTVAGYRAALIAASAHGRFFPLLMTAAGTIAPARVLVIGAGVAGLQAIATTRRLGAVVEGFDIRPAVREEVESLGAVFVGPDVPPEEATGAGGYARELSAARQEESRRILAERVAHADVVISSAMVPGRPAPKLITGEMVRRMRPGSVIVDMAADAGGNCELTVAGEERTVNDVRVLGPLNIAAQLPVHASQMYARNVTSLLLHLWHDGAFQFDFDDEITRETCVTHRGGEVPRAAAASVPAGPK
jgi:NAD(P) transhydrogenase subunit alpha